MKPAWALLLTLCVTLFLLTGCDPGMLAEVSAQLRQPERYIELVREDEDFTLRFRSPIIPRSSLPALGLGGTIPPGASVKAGYWLEVNGSGRRKVDVTLQFAGDFLQSISVPALLLDLLGRANIETILRLAGGAALPGWASDPVTPATIEAVLAAQNFSPDPPGNCVLVKLSPTATAARTLVVKIQRHPPDEDFRDVTVSFRK